MAKIEKRKREKLWWMEENEEQFVDGSKLTEAYDPSRLEPGYDGRNGPDVKQLYAKKGEARFDNMGAGTGTKPKKGDADKAELTVKESKKVTEAFGEEDEPMPDEDMGMEDEGMGMDDEVPPEMDEPIEDDNFEHSEHEEMGGEGEEIADDIHIEIAGQRFKLVPEAPEEGMEGEEDFGDEFGGEEEFNEPMEGAEVGAEDQDVEFPESAKSVKGAIKEAKTKKEKAAYVQKLLKMKSFAEKQLNELFTGDYVEITGKNGKLPGMDFSSVAGDKNYAVVDRAASGKQYTVTDSKSPYEPGSDAKGQTAGKVQKTAAPSKESFKKWLANQKKISEDEDAGKTSADFNVEDTFGKDGLDDDFANKPEVIGGGEDLITKTDTQKESTASRLAAIKKSRMERRQEGAPVAKTEKLEEEFDFKALMNGKYSKN